MENSIEETIKQLKLILKVRKEQKEKIECAGGSCMNCDPDIKALDKSIYFLSEYKKVLKENKKLKSAIGIANKLEQEIKKQYVPKQKIQNKIEELYQENNNWTEELSEPDSNFRRVDRNLKRIKNQIDVLQELLERGKIYGRKNSEGN